MMPRQAFEPEIGDHVKVEILIAARWSEEDIAIAIGCSRPTLRRHFADNLRLGRLRRRAEVLVGLHDEAVGGKVGAVRQFLALTEPPAPADPESDVPATQTPGRAA